MANGKFTLLQVVQKTLEALGGDEVSSISDSVESEQIAQFAQDAYYELLNQREWPHLLNLRQLESVADNTKPNYLRIPDDVVRIDQVKYDNTDTGAALVEINEVTWCEPEQFLNVTQLRNTERTDVQTITDFSGVRYHILTDDKPQIWTSFDDEYIVMDAFQNDIDSTLQGNKSQALVKSIPDFVIADGTVADAPAHFFQTWMSEVKSTAMWYLRQEISQKDEQKARRGLSVLRRDASRTENSDGKVRFGRPTRNSLRNS
jgi:hypothetical protein